MISPLASLLPGPAADTVPDGPNPLAGPPGLGFEYLPDPVWVFDARDRIVGWNRAAELVYGLPAAHAVGQSALLFVPHAPTDAFSRAPAATRRHGAWAGGLATQTATELPVPVEARWALAGPAGDPAAVVVALHQPGTPPDAEGAARAAAWRTARSLAAAVADELAAAEDAVAREVADLTRAFAAEADPRADRTIGGGGGGVLVVASSHLLRELLQAVLGGVGHVPVAAADRYEAARAVAWDGGRLRAAVLACGPDNPGVAAAVWRGAAGLPVLALGHPAAPDCPFLPLPAGPARILRALAEAIAADRLEAAGG